jgi:hypothetical protein
MLRANFQSGIGIPTPSFTGYVILDKLLHPSGVLHHHIKLIIK